MAKPKIRKARVLYAGLRVNGDRVAQLFLYGKKECFWHGVKHVEIGKYYESFFENGAHRMKRVPDCLGDAEIDAETMELWVAQNAAARAMRARKSAASQAGRVRPYKRDLARLKAVFKKLSWKEQSAFVDAIAEELHAK